MSSQDQPVRERQRDSTRSREQLLHAARDLFTERGYDRTTLRDVGERAGLDASLIARYFGSKDDLFRLVMRSDLSLDARSGDVAGLVADLLRIWDERGVGAAAQALVQISTPDEARLQGIQAIRDRIVTPLGEHFAASGISSPQLKAEAVFAAMVGIGVIRQAGSLPELHAAERSELEQILGAVLTQFGRPDVPEAVSGGPTAH